MVSKVLGDVVSKVHALLVDLMAMVLENVVAKVLDDVSTKFSVMWQLWFLNFLVKNYGFPFL